MPRAAVEQNHHPTVVDQPGRGGVALRRSLAPKRSLGTQLVPATLLAVAVGSLALSRSAQSGMLPIVPFPPAPTQKPPC